MSHEAGHIIIQKRRVAESTGLDVDIDIALEESTTPEDAGKKVAKILRLVNKMQEDGDA